MTPRQKTPTVIAREFPGRDALIDRAYREDLSFRDLCRDYLTCAETLEEWRRSDDETATVRAGEYADLLNRLGREISSWLESMEGSSASSGRVGSP